LSRRCHDPERVSFAKAPLDVIKQGTDFEWLSEKAESASRGSFLIELPVGQSRDEHHGGGVALSAKLAEEIKSAHPRHVDVGDDTVQAKPARRHQERFGGAERLGAIAHGTHQIDQGQAQRFIVVDNCDERDRHRS
jgi:hypothetical protein